MRGSAVRITSSSQCEQFPRTLSRSRLPREVADGNMRQRLLFLTTLVPLVLAPRPPADPGSGSHPRLGKSRGSKLEGWPQRARRDGGAGCGVWGASGASPRSQCGKGVWLSAVSERKDTGLSLSEEGHPGRGLSQGPRAREGSGLLVLYFWNVFSGEVQAWGWFARGGSRSFAC